MKFCPNYAENRVFGEKTPFFSAKIATFHMIFSRVRRGVNGYPRWHWLTKEEAEKLVNTPVTRWQREEIPVLKAIHNQAILAVMIGTGLRRSEVAS